MHKGNKSFHLEEWNSFHTLSSSTQGTCKGTLAITMVIGTWRQVPITIGLPSLLTAQSGRTQLTNLGLNACHGEERAF